MRVTSLVEERQRRNDALRDTLGSDHPEWSGPDKGTHAYWILILTPLSIAFSALCIDILSKVHVPL